MNTTSYLLTWLEGTERKGFARLSTSSCSGGAGSEVLPACLPAERRRNVTTRRPSATAAPPAWLPATRHNNVMLGRLPAPVYFWRNRALFAAGRVLNEPAPYAVAPCSRSRAWCTWWAPCRVHWPPVRVRCPVVFSLSASFAHERPARRCSWYPKSTPARLVSIRSAQTTGRDYTSAPLLRARHSCIMSMTSMRSAKI